MARWIVRRYFPTMAWRTRCTSAGLPTAGGRTWNEASAYDVVYTRFLLHHLSRPVELLRRMWAAVRPGGVIIVEDADFDGWFCHPPNEGFDFFLRAYRQVVARRGGDHAAGRKLHAYFTAAGIPDPPHENGAGAAPG
jgi:SAM-dependent methyltransferase